jgi:hypothetical protein
MILPQEVNSGPKATPPDSLKNATISWGDNVHLTLVNRLLEWRLVADGAAGLRREVCRRWEYAWGQLVLVVAEVVVVAVDVVVGASRSLARARRWQYSPEK